MATARRQPVGLLDASGPEAAAFSQLFGTLAANPAVERIALDDLGGYIDLWARLDDADEAREMALYDALAAYHNAAGVTTPIELHLVLADEPEDAFPANLH